tara:strand:- start:417 stop:2267 length:1851 start_codon:yes stop_codon:yes gene_type:complete
MCGIWASLGLTVTPEVIDIVQHRGPDGRGWKEFTNSAGKMCLGHRRLAVIDLSKLGHQPMTDEGERYWLTFNGEIYNFLELRKELEGLGHSFKSFSDSEVLLKAFIQWGDRMLPRLEGMFAFSIWDQCENRLFAARDRFGIKPLYIWKTERGVAFASECKQFTACGDFRPTLNRSAAMNFLASAVTDFESATLFDGVEHVLPGHAVSVQVSKNNKIDVETSDWFKGARLPAVEKSDYTKLIDKFQKLFDRALRAHLVSDVQIGSCLSGGLDSSSIVVGLASKIPKRVVTYSACFDHPDIDERPYMDTVISLTGAEENRVFPEPQLIPEKIALFSWHQDEPVPSTSPLAQWAVFERASQDGVKVMLDGQGADELIGGYRYMLHAHLLDQAKRLKFPSMLSLFREFPCVRPPGNLLMASLRAIYWAYQRGTDKISAVDLPTWIKPSFAKECNFPVKTVPYASDFTEICQRMTFDRGLRALLRYEDRTSMAHGVEARVPFLDNCLADLCLRLPTDARLNDGWMKRVLRDALGDTLPRNVALRRDKIGFATPEAIWLTGSLRGWAISRVLEAVERWPNIFDEKQIDDLLEQGLKSPEDYEASIWRIISFDAWARAFSVKY